MIEKSKIDFLNPYLYKVYAQPNKIIKQPAITRFTDFDNSYILNNQKQKDGMNEYIKNLLPNFKKFIKIFSTTVDGFDDNIFREKCQSY